MTAIPSSTSPAALESILAAVRSRVGLFTPAARRRHAEAGIGRAMARAGIPTARRYLALLVESTTLMDDLVSELTIDESYFFRVAEHFDFVRHVAVPEVRARRGDQHVPRVWSAGCAAGEETYSLAIAFREMGRDVSIVGTDVCRASLERARSAVYRRWAVRGIDGARLGRWFRPHESLGETWQLCSEVACRVAFEHHSLLSRSGPSGAGDFDVIMCRNVLIYFDADGVTEAAERLYDALAPGGWLMTGPCDPPLAGLAPFEIVATDAGVFYRRPAETGGEEATLPANPPSRQEPSGARDPWTAAPVELAAEGGRRAMRPASHDRVERARRALTDGDYQGAWLLTREPVDAREATLHLRAAANALNTHDALEVAHDMAARHPTCAAIHFLGAALLMADGQDAEALDALRRTLYLDASIAVVHFMMGDVLERRGRGREACRAYRAARDVARAQAPGTTLRLSDGQRAEALAEEAERRLQLLVSSGCSR